MLENQSMEMFLHGFFQNFQGDDAIMLDDFYKLVSDALEEFVQGGFEKASRKYSRKRIS